MNSLKTTIGNLWFITRFSLRFSKMQYVIAITDIIFDSILPFVDLLFPKWIIDELSNEKRWEKVFFFILAWAGINGVILLLKSLKWIMLNPYNSRCDFKESIMWGNLNAKMDYEKLENGAVMDEQNRIKNNLYMSAFAYQPLATFVSTLIRLIGYTYIVATLHPLMIVFLLLMISLTLLLSKRKEKTKYEFNRNNTRFQRLFQYLFNIMTGISYAKEVRINNASSWIVNRFLKEQDNYLKAFQKKENNIYCSDFLSDLVVFIQTASLYLYSSYRVVTGTISLGSFSLYIGTVSAFCGTFINMLEQLTNIRFLSDYITSFRDYLDSSKSFHEKKGIVAIDKTSGKFELELQNVSFKYPGKERYAIQNISITIKSGERLSVVGVNGSGKSTLIKLICRLYEPTEGRILLNGVDISTLKYEEYIDLFAVIFQDYNLYPMSIRDNICLGQSIDDNAISEALEKSGLMEKVATLSLGLDAQLGKDFDPDGIVLSGGEQQKLVSARAYVRNSSIIILDEPTASLDAIAESHLYNDFNNIIGDKTAIYVSHRLSSAKFCDRIVVFNEGKIVESGTHSELMTSNGIYSEMFLKQSEGYFVSQGEG